jgi:hypothetical protein
MELFFEKRKSSTHYIINTYIELGIAIFIIIKFIMEDFNWDVLKYAFLLLGYSWIIDGIESYIKKENMSRYFLYFAVGLGWTILYVSPSSFLILLFVVMNY